MESLTYVFQFKADITDSAIQNKAAKILLVAITTVIRNISGSESQAGNINAGNGRFYTVFNVSTKLHRLGYFKKVKAFKNFYSFCF